jgi:DDE superfamily endonuclease
MLETDSDEFIALYSIIAVTAILIIVNPVTRNPSIFDQRLKWDEFAGKHGSRTVFKRHMRMSLASFNKILGYIRADLEVDNRMAALRGGAIMPEIALYLCLRLLAGGSYSDIFFFTGVSQASFYRLFWKTLAAINKCPELAVTFPQTAEECRAAAAGFASISDQRCISNCVACADGYLLRIFTPSKKDALNVKSFFSGHYQCYGVNVQGACDYHCRFVFLAVAGPGVMGDREACKESGLWKLIEKLPGIYCAIGDCAYMPTEHMVPIFGGVQGHKKTHDDFNFFASQCRIRIEMAFGLMVKKWGILNRPLTFKLINIKKVVVGIARLHNFCINERLSHHNHDNAAYNPGDVDLSSYEQALRDTAADVEFRHAVADYQNPWSHNGDHMVTIVANKNMSRPGLSRKKRN